MPPGIRVMVDSKVDYTKSQNLILTSVVFVAGLSGVAIKIGGYEIKGMVMSAVVAIVLSLIFYVLEKLQLTNDRGLRNIQYYIIENTEADRHVGFRVSLYNTFLNHVLQFCGMSFFICTYTV